MNNNMDFEYLPFNEEDDSDELTGKVTISLMSMMRAKYEYSPAAMKLDEDLTEEFSHSETDSIEKKKTSKNSVGEENLISECDTKSRIENFVSTLAKEKSIKKERSTYRSYNTDQISRFLTLVTEQVSVKEAALYAGITKSTAYRFKKQWEELKTVPSIKKRGPSKGTGTILTEVNSFFIINIIDSYVPTTLEKMGYKLLEAYPELSK